MHLRHWDWDDFRSFLFSRGVLEGVVFTIMLSVTAQIVGSLIGLGLYFFVARASCRSASSPILYLVLPWHSTHCADRALLATFPYLRIGNTLDQAFNFKAEFGLTNEYFVSGLLAHC